MKRKLSLLLTSIMLVLSIPINASAANTAPPEIIGESALVIDVDTGEIIYAKNADTKNYPASITKLLTSLILAEEYEEGDTIAYTKLASQQNAYSLYNIMSVHVGDTMNAENLMNALLLYSANDSAYMVADYVSNNDYEEYETMMNAKLSKLGMTNSHFVTADGYHDEDHYTTAYDLSLLVRAANENSWVSEVMQTKEAKISLDNGITANIENRNKLVGEPLESGAICIAGKTGYTSAAGRCLAAIFEKDGRKLAGVVLQSQYYPDDTYVFDDMEKIIDWSFEAEKVNYSNNDTDYVENTEVDTITVKYSPLYFFGPQKETDLQLVIKEDVEYYENEINNQEIKVSIDTESIDSWELDKEVPVGTLTVTQREAKTTYNLYPTKSTKDLIGENKLLYIASAVGLLVLILILAALIRKAGSRKKRGGNRYRY